MNPTAGNGPLGLRIIGAFKLLTAVLVTALGFGLFHHMGSGPGDQIQDFVKHLKLDPDNYYVHSVVEKVSHISPKQLKAIRLGTFLYAALYAVEGVGLLMRKHWAEYFTVIATGSLIPLEVYEIWRHPTAVKIGVLAINLAIVGYLIYQLARKENRGAGAEAAPAA